jgi:hypothetical protein
MPRTDIEAEVSLGVRPRTFGGLYRLPDSQPRLALSYSLRARKPG